MNQKKKKIIQLNQDDNVNGILLQLPLNREFYSKEDEDRLISLIDSSKDVDGLTSTNQAKLFMGENQDKFLIAVSKKGYIKKMNLSDIGVATRGTKGKKIQKLDDDDMTVKTLTINTDRDIIINTKGRVIKINSSEISLLSRDAAGTKSMNLEENEQIQDMLIS